MALTWDWKKKVGEFTYNGYTVNLYEGNAFLIAIDEFRENGEDKYNLVWYLLDKQHAKMFMGLNDVKYDTFGGKVERIVLYMDTCKNWKDILELFGKTQKNCVFILKPSEKSEVA